MQDRVYSRCSLDGKSLLSIVGFRRFAVGSSPARGYFCWTIFDWISRFWKPSSAGAYLLARDVRAPSLFDAEIHFSATKKSMTEPITSLRASRTSGSLLSDSYAWPYMCNRVVNSEHGPRSSGSYSSSILSLLPMYTFFFLDDDFLVAVLGRFYFHPSTGSQAK